MHETTGESWVTETEIEVRSYELDSFGHANHAVFLNWLEHGRFDLLRAVGMPAESLPGRGLGVYVIRLEIDYLREARVGERLLVRTRVGEFRRTSMVLDQQIVLQAQAEVVLARARVTAVWVGADRRPTRVPDEVRSAFGA
jgi:YbgC/YbaW family acyl-CoA thioester hydrolase